jgi:hypothetical protein
MRMRIAAVGFLLLATACGSSGVSAGTSTEPPTTTATNPPTILAPPPPTGPGDTAPVEPRYGTTRADTSPESSKTATAAMSDPHNPQLDDAINRLGLHNVWMETVPTQPGRDNEYTRVYFDLRDAPYSGPLVLFSVRPGGGELKGTVKGLTLPMVIVEKGKVVGLELDASDPAVFTPDDPSLVPSSAQSRE